MKTYQFIIELEDDPVTPFTEKEIEEIKQHIENAMNSGIDLPSINQLMYLNGAFNLEHKIKD